MYFKEEKIDIYIKKVSSKWDQLIEEIKKTETTRLRVIVHKSSTKKEKILSKLISITGTKNDSAEWEKNLIDIIENNICINIHIICDLKKKEII